MEVGDRMSKIFTLLLMSLMFLVSIPACDDHYDAKESFDHPIGRIHVDRTWFRDPDGRYLYLNGVNLSGSTKVPATTNPISYTGKPFPLDEADWNFRMLRKLGFNTVRLLVIWEGIEPYAKGDYDLEYLDYIEKVVAKAYEYGIYVLVDFHQDMYSRHLFTLYNDGTNGNALTDEKEQTLAAPFGYNNRIGGDGAPEWAVAAALPDKNVGGPEWGLPPWDVTRSWNTVDFIPITPWYFNYFLSVDANRNFAAFFAGDVVWPDYRIDGMNLKDYLQGAYIDSWKQVVTRLKDYPNIVGYDIMNEPCGVFIALPIYALLYNEAKADPKGELTPAAAVRVLDAFLDESVQGGMSQDFAEELRSLWIDYGLLPTSKEDLEKSGLFPSETRASMVPDLGVAIGLNSNFDRTYLQPFLEKAGQAIQEIDPDAVFFIEPALALPSQGIMGQFAFPMTRPAGLKQVVFEPHFYEDIYPEIGYNSPPREFNVDEIRFRDYTDGIESALSEATFSLGNPPVVMGEYGTYYNFGGINESMEHDYAVSAYLLETYFKTYDEILLHRILWCYSSENTPTDGEGWNKEDFSLLGPDRKPRAWQAYSRTFPFFTSGRLTSMRYYSSLHYFEPRPGEPTPELEFTMEMLGLESGAPTEVFVPPMVYEDGFYVYVSDGKCAFDPNRFVLEWYPSNDAPDAVHALKIRPPYADYGDEDWNYFFHDDEALEGAK
jgi:hypothetical protein